MKVNGYLLTVTEAKTYLQARGSIPADSNFCLIKDTTGGYVGPGANNLFYIDTTVSPISTYTNNRYPRYQDIVPSCNPGCTYAFNIGNTTNCSGGTASKTIIVNSNCLDSEVRLEAVGNGAVTTAWQNAYNFSTTLTFTNVPVGTYRAQARRKSGSPSIECPSAYSSNFNICCDTNPTWTNNGATFCGGSGNCTLFQPQIDTNFCSSTYNTTRNLSLGTSDSCGTWSAPTQYCPNYGVYPFQLRVRETNSCTGNTRNDALVANLSPTCGYNCGYWGLTISFNGYYCNNTTNGSGVVTVSANATNGSFQVRLVSTGAGVTTGWQTGLTFTGVFDGTYYAEVRSDVDNSCTASTLSNPQQYQTVSCCSTTPNWVNNGAVFCSGCTLYQPQIDNNPCSASYNQTRNVDLGVSDVCGSWNGQYYCSGCDYRYREINSCTGGVRNDQLIQSNSPSCGGCCGQSTTPNWQNTGQYSCYSTCNKYNVEQDVNPCSGTYGQTRQGSLVESNSGFCYVPGLNCCGQATTPNWVNNGGTFCSGCNLYQPQIDNNPCSATYNQTQNVDLGVNSNCGTWNLEYYCVGYTKWSRERNSCTNATRNDTVVEYDSPFCGYTPYYYYYAYGCNGGYQILRSTSSGLSGTVKASDGECWTIDTTTSGPSYYADITITGLTCGFFPCPV